MKCATHIKDPKKKGKNKTKWRDGPDLGSKDACCEEHDQPYRVGLFRRAAAGKKQ